MMGEAHRQSSVLITLAILKKQKVAMLCISFSRQPQLARRTPLCMLCHLRMRGLSHTLVQGGVGKPGDVDAASLAYTKDRNLDEVVTGAVRNLHTQSICKLM